MSVLTDRSSFSKQKDKGSALDAQVQWADRCLVSSPPTEWSGLGSGSHESTGQGWPSQGGEEASQIIESQAPGSSWQLAADVCSGSNRSKGRGARISGLVWQR